MKPKINEKLDQFAFLAELDKNAELATSPCGKGEIVWRIWGEGPPLVLLHGAHGSWTHWVKNISFLSKYFKLFVPDLPGMGDSGMPPAPFTFKNISKIISNGIDIVLPYQKKFDVVGFSFGSSIAGHLAFYQGRRVKSLGLISSGGMGLNRNEPKGLKNWRYASSETKRIAANRYNLGILMFGNEKNVDDFAVYLQTINTRRTEFKSRSINKRWATMVPILPKISAKIFGVWGENDVYSKGYIYERKAYLKKIQKDASFCFVPESGHWVIYEHANIVNDFLLNELRGLSEKI